MSTSWRNLLVKVSRNPYSHLFAFPREDILWCPVFKAATSSWYRNLLRMSYLPQKEQENLIKTQLKRGGNRVLVGPISKTFKSASAFQACLLSLSLNYYSHCFKKWNRSDFLLNVFHIWMSLDPWLDIVTVFGDRGIFALGRTRTAHPRASSSCATHFLDWYQPTGNNSKTTGVTGLTDLFTDPSLRTSLIFGTSMFMPSPWWPSTGRERFERSLIYLTSKF